MQRITIEDRRRELTDLLARIRQHPERDWTVERRRAAELQRAVAVHQTAHP